MKSNHIKRFNDLKEISERLSESEIDDLSLLIDEIIEKLEDEVLPKLEDGKGKLNKKQIESIKQIHNIVNNMGIY
jgi:hypothetical protein